MNDRLNKIQNYINPGIGVVDVGTDHGYIPINLALNSYPGNIFATDLNEAPLSKAYNNAVLNNVSNRITFIQSDGLDDIKPDTVDTIIIAGMGGDLICDILDRAEWTMSKDYSFILQPMTKAEILRYWLINNGYTIVYDDIIIEQKRPYSILYVKYTGEIQIYSDAQLYVGYSYYDKLIEKVINTLSKKPKSAFFDNIFKRSNYRAERRQNY